MESKLQSDSKSGYSAAYAYKMEPARLEGLVSVGGAKNSALRLLAASILTDEQVTLTNYPSSLLDCKIHEEMLRSIGKIIEVQSSVVSIRETSSKLSTSLIWDQRSIRNTLLILGALLTRFGEGKVPLPGGCQLGERKFDLHQMVFESMGAKVWQEDGYLCAHARGRLKGGKVVLPIRSTGATENAILCGVLAIGVSEIWNPHVRPEILDLCSLLNKMGACIEIFGQERIRVTGCEFLRGADHRVIQDGMEALTWLIASVVSGGDVEIEGFPVEDLEVPLIFLRESGARYYQCKDRLIVRGGKSWPIDICTGPYPGINSDMQPLFAVFGAMAEGESRITDLRFPGRYQYAGELEKMGLIYRSDENLLKIFGRTEFKGAEVRATDLRAGVALALAALVAKDQTLIRDAWQIDRGYHDFLPKLRSLGAKIDRV